MKKIILSFLLIAVGMVSACATQTTISPSGSLAEIEREARLQKEMAFSSAP